MTSGKPIPRNTRTPNHGRAVKNLSEMATRIMMDGFVLERKCTKGTRQSHLHLPFILADKIVRIGLVPITENTIKYNDCTSTSMDVLKDTIAQLISKGVVYEKKIGKTTNNCAIISLPASWSEKRVRVIVIPTNSEDSLSKDRKIAELRIQYNNQSSHLTQLKNRITKLEGENKTESAEVEVKESEEIKIFNETTSNELEDENAF